MFSRSGSTTNSGIPPRMPNARTKGQIEAEISDAMVRLHREQTGRGPTQARTHIVEDMVIVRLQEVLTPAERQLTGNPHGQSLIKQFHQQMHEIARRSPERRDRARMTPLTLDLRKRSVQNWLFLTPLLLLILCRLILGMGSRA